MIWIYLMAYAALVFAVSVGVFIGITIWDWTYRSSEKIREIESSHNECGCHGRCPGDGQKDCG